MQPSFIRRAARYSTDAATEQDFHALFMRIKEGLKDTYPTSQTFWLTLFGFGGVLWGATQWGISHQLEGVRLDVKHQLEGVRLDVKQMGVKMDERMDGMKKDMDGMKKDMDGMKKDVAEIKELFKKAPARRWF